MPSTDAVGRAVPQSTVRVLESALEALAAGGYGDLAASIARRRTTMLSRPPTVVVVGELSRGKSSVVNALLGTPDLAPVGSAETTAISVAFSPPRDDLAAGAVRLTFASGVRYVGVDELAEWVTVDGTKAGSDDAAELRAVEVGAQSLWLPGAMIVDTPGSGGLSELFARRALQTAEWAGILLVVTDASGRISADAARFLAKAATYAGHILVLVNKIDQNRQWRRVLEENESVLRRDAQIPVSGLVGVSALSARRAMLSPAQADDWWGISGFPDVQQALAVPMARAERLPEVAALRQARAGVQRILEDLSSDLAAEQGTEDVIDQLAEKQEEYQDLLDNSSGWKYRLGRALRELQNPIRRDAAATIDRFQMEWQSRINKGLFGLSAAQIAAQREQMRAEVETFEFELRGALAAGTLAAARELFASAGMDVPPELAHVGFTDPVASDDASVAAPGNALQIASIAMLGASPAMRFGVWGVPFAIVGLVGALFVAKRIRNRAEAQQSFTLLVRTMRERVQQYLQDSGSHMSIDVAELFEGELRRRTRTLSRQVDAARQARAAADSDRRNAQKRVQDQISRVRATDSAIAEELRRLTTHLAGATR